MLEGQLRDKWRAREQAVPISAAMIFGREGLVLGAGTVLAPAEGICGLKSLKGQEQRILALLSAAHGKAVSPSVLGNIERAGKAWSKGDNCLAYIHLAHARLQPPEDTRSAACRLFIAEIMMSGGAAPRAIFQALKIGNSYIDAVEKAYNPAEPRVPAGSGRMSGEWTDSEGTAGEESEGSSLLGRTSPPPASFLGALDAAEAAELGLYASRLLGPIAAAAAAFGLLFIPSPNDVRVEGEVPGIPELRYSWNRDETLLHLTYDGPDGGQRTFSAQLDGDVFRDAQGRVIGRVLSGSNVAIDAAAVSPDLVDEDEPRLCPAPAPDVAGSDQGKSYEENRSRQYEDFVKLLINPPPDGPTPSGFVYYLSNPGENGEPVSFDDCKWTNGILFEIKGEGYAKLTNDLPDVMTDDFVDQATRQLEASGGRPFVWIFAEEQAALFARRLFDKTPGLERITVEYVPWIKRVRQ